MTSALLLPFLLVSMLAAGTMPVRAASGMVDLVICAGDHFVTVSVPASQAPPGEKPVEHRACPWDDAAQPLLAQNATPFASPPLAFAPAQYEAWHRAAEMCPRNRQVSNRGPPLAT